MGVLYFGCGDGKAESKSSMDCLISKTKNQTEENMELINRELRRLRERAEKRSAKHNREELKIKKCLKCRDEFIPAHRTNFLCGICTQVIKKETGLNNNYDYHSECRMEGKHRLSVRAALLAYNLNNKDYFR